MTYKQRIKSIEEIAKTPCNYDSEMQRRKEHRGRNGIVQQLLYLAKGQSKFFFFSFGSPQCPESNTVVKEEA